MQLKESIQVTTVKWLLILTILPILGLSYFSMNQFEKALNYELKQSTEKSIDGVYQWLATQKEKLLENSKNYQANLRLVQSLYYSNVKGSLDLANEYFEAQNLQSLSFFNKSGTLLVNISRLNEDQIATYVADVNNPIYLSEETSKKVKENKLAEGHETLPKKLTLLLTTSLLNVQQEVIGYAEQTLLVSESDLMLLSKDSKSFLGFISLDEKIFLATHDDLYLLQDDVLNKIIDKKFIPDFKIRGESYFAQVSKNIQLDKPFIVFVARDKKDSNIILNKIKMTFLTVMSFVILLTVFLIVVGKKELNKQIIELKNANEKIKQTQSQLVLNAKMASLGQLIAGVAHELNNPISFIYSNMSALKNYSEKIIHFVDKSEKNPEQIKKYKEENEIDYIVQDFPKLIKSCEDGSLRIKNIVQNLQSFSRTNANDLKKVNIHECIDTTLNILSHNYNERVQIAKEYGPIPLIQANPGQLNQVFMNLLSNAFQAIQSQGAVKITTLNLKDKIEIKISDNGAGISKENLENIFDPFFTTKQVGDGTGLGLSITFGIIKQHRGKIEVQSQLGQGTEFTIQLPI